MTVQHFMRADLVGATLGTILFAYLLVPPGYLFGWIFDLLQFRKQSWPWQILLSLLYSVSLVPIVLFLLWNYLPVYVVWTFYGLSTAFMLAAFIWARKPGAVRIPAWCAWAILGWAVAACLSGIDLQFGNRLYPSVLIYDFNIRTAFIDGIARHGLPATNPLFFPGHTVPLRYHYFWFIPCALVDRLGGSWVNARQALIASDVWCGWALMAIVIAYLRFFHPAGERGISQRAKWGIALLAIAGLDILPNLLFAAVYWVSGAGLVFASSEWWNNPVTGFPHAVLWVSHHVAAVIACFTGFLILWRGNRTYVRSAICAGLAFASAAGLSIYVVFAFGVFLMVWGSSLILRKRWRDTAAWTAAGAVAIICALPYLRSISDPNAPTGRLILPTVRSFSFFDIVLPSYGLNWNQIAWANLFILPLNYFLETGVWFFLAGVWLIRAKRRGRRMTETEVAALCMFGVVFLIATFLKSGVIANNDLAWRSALIGQLILLIWAVGPVRACWRSRKRHSTVAALVVLGLASSVYELMILRSYMPLLDAGAVPIVTWFTHDKAAGRRTFDARQGYEALQRALPVNAIIQANPNHWDDLYHGAYALRQTAAFDAGCGTGMGGNPQDCERMLVPLDALFNDPTAARTIDIDQTCEAWGISALVAKDDDPIFRDHGNWLWSRPALAENEHVRAIPCGSVYRLTTPLSTSASTPASGR